MYTIENKTNVFYLYDFSTQNFSRIGDYTNFINLIVNKFVIKNYYSKRYDYSLNVDDINFTGDDIYVSVDWNGEVHRTFRKCMFFDGENRIIDVRNYIDDIVKGIRIRVEKEIANDIKRKNGTYIYSWQNKKQIEYRYGDILVKKAWKKDTPDICYAYRRGPVPYTSKAWRGGANCHKKYGKIVRMVKHPDFKVYNRVSHYDDVMASVYDYEIYNYRTVTKSWKQNKKIKRQWQKNLH